MERARRREGKRSRKDTGQREREEMEGGARERKKERRGKCTHKSLDRDTCTSLRTFSFSLSLSSFRSPFLVGSLVHLLPSTDEHRRQASRFMPVRGITRGQLSAVTVGGILDEGFSRSLVGCHTFKILPFVSDRKKGSTLPLLRGTSRFWKRFPFVSRV